MFDSISARWQTLKTKFKKIIPFIFTFIFVFINPVSAFAYDSISGYFVDSFVFCTTSNTDKQLYMSIQDSTVEGIWYGYTPFDSSLLLYKYSNPTINNAYQIRFGSDKANFNFQYFPELYDYYLTLTVHSNTYNSPSDFTFLPDKAYFRTYNGSGVYTNYFSDDVASLPFEDNNNLGFTVSIKIPELDNSDVGIVHLRDTNLGSVSSNLVVEGQIIAFTKDTDTSSATIVNAINNQTSTLGGKLDNTNNLITNGNGFTSGIVSGAASSKSELDSIVSEYQLIENSMLDNFTLYQSDILSDVTGWSWGGLSTCANWVGDTLTSYFQNMGDFKQYITYPLLLGIALFFIGRGSAIIGHLYRKPTVTTTISNRESITYKHNGTKYTDSKTTTYRDGGVLRK